MSESMVGMPNMILTAEAAVVPQPLGIAAFQPPPVAQTYLLSAIQAVLAGCHTLAQQPVAAGVKDAASAIETALSAAQPALQRPIDAASWEENATQVIGMVQEVLPTVAPFMGPAARYVTMALMVAQMVVVMSKSVLPHQSTLHLVAPR